MLALLAVLAPPVWTAAAEMLDAFMVREAREQAARLFAEARWAAVADGGAKVLLVQDPPSGLVVSDAGDTVAFADLGLGGVSVAWTGRDAVSFGPLGLGKMAARTLTFSLRGQSRQLVVSSYGRVLRR